MTGAGVVSADAQAVVDWYREQLALVTHRAAFAECALTTEQRAAAQVREELGLISRQVQVLQDAAERCAGEAHWLRPDHPDFPAWVQEHWDAIQDAHLAHVVEHADRPAAVEAL